MGVGNMSCLCLPKYYNYNKSEGPKQRVKLVIVQSGTRLQACRYNFGDQLVKLFWMKLG